MNAEAVKNLIIESAGDFGEVLLLILGACLVIGIGFLIFRVGWGLIRNMPGDWGYSPRRKSYFAGRGKNVDIPTGGRIF